MTPIVRCYSTPAAPSTTPLAVPIALISKIRSLRPGTPLSLARSALQASSNSLPDALAWISEQAAASGAAKSKKLEGREAKEGLIGVALVADGLGEGGVRGAMVEISCETDFVARTDQFRELVESVARSLAFFAEPVSIGADASIPHLKHHSTESVNSTPVIPLPSVSSAVVPTSTIPTISTSISTLVSLLGENISLRRSLSFTLPSFPIDSAYPTHLASTFLHNAVTSGPDKDFQSGSLAGLLLFKLPKGGKVEKADVKKIMRVLARQVVAVPTSSVRSASNTSEAPSPSSEGEQSLVLYDQALLTLSSSEELAFEQGANVQSVLGIWSKGKGIEGEGLQVVEVERWEVGGGMKEQ